MKVSEVLELVRSEFTGDEVVFCNSKRPKGAASSPYICTVLTTHRGIPRPTLDAARLAVAEAIYPHFTLFSRLIHWSMVPNLNNEGYIYHEPLSIYLLRPGNSEIYHRLRNQFLLDLIVAQQLKEQQNETYGERRAEGHCGNPTKVG